MKRKKGKEANGEGSVVKSARLIWEEGRGGGGVGDKKDEYSRD